jgi:acyl-CoA thioester hydrolase
MDKMTFTMTIDVDKNHLDVLDHVNNLEYLKWGESIAKKHWEYLTSEANIDKHLWVILKHEIEYKKEGRLGDEIKVITWVGDTSALRSVRHFEFYRKDDLLATMATTFCLFSFDTRKPVKISAEIRKLLLPVS